MTPQQRPQSRQFSAKEHDLSELADTLSHLKSLASRTPTPVTVGHLEAIDRGREVSVLLLQFQGNAVVGMIHAGISHLEDRAIIGPIAVDRVKGGWGTPLMEDMISHIRRHFPHLRRIDVTSRRTHLADWYQKFGFRPRSKEAGDPTTVYRLDLE